MSTEPFADHDNGILLSERPEVVAVAKAMAKYHGPPARWFFYSRQAAAAIAALDEYRASLPERGEAA